MGKLKLFDVFWYVVHVYMYIYMHVYMDIYRYSYMIVIITHVHVCMYCYLKLSPAQTSVLDGDVTSWQQRVWTHVAVL